MNEDAFVEVDLTNDDFIPLSNDDEEVDVEMEADSKDQANGSESSEEDDDDDDDIDRCLKGISEMRAVMQILIDQMSKQQSTIDKILEQQAKLLARVTSVEDSSKKQQKILNKFMKKYCGMKNDSHNTSVDGGTQAQRLKDHIARESSPSVIGPKKMSEAIKVSSHKVKRLQRSSKSSKAKKLSQMVRRKKVEVSKDSKSHVQLTAKSECSNQAVTAPVAKSIVNNEKALSSSEIDRSSLISVDEVLHKYESYITTEKVTHLAYKLAEEAVIGNEALIRCTPKGRFSYPALPVDSLYTIKQTLLNVFPKYWDKPDEFEDVWLQCLKRIERHCCALRAASRTLAHEQSPNRANETCHSNVDSPPPNAPTVSTVDVRNPLPSSEIKKQDLMSVKEFLSQYTAGIKNGKYGPGMICQRLAFDAIFGREVLIRCTPLGRSHYPGLPVAEMNLLKQTLLDCFPKYWNDASEFESIWTKQCVRNLVNVCAKMRQKSSLKGSPVQN